MTEGIKGDEFKDIEEMIRRILEHTLHGPQGTLPSGFRIIVTGGEISGGGERVPSPPSRIVEEPATEVFEEGDEIRILVEVPGAALSTTHLQITGRVLRIYADGGARRYKTSVELPPIQAETMASRLYHGVLEITFLLDPS
jgi:HSP20 family protein